MRLAKHHAEAGVMHFWEFEFVFVEAIPPLGHSFVDADVIEENDSAFSHQRSIESHLGLDLFGNMFCIDEEDVDRAPFGNLGG